MLLTVCCLTSIHAQTITGGEYFFDTDPGIGSGTSFSVSPDDTIAANLTIDLSSISPGLHFYNVRVKDSDERWSFTHSSLFFALSGGDPVVTGGEYFFDSDPGIGQATAFSVSPDSTVSTNLVIDLSSIAPGLHFFNIRMKDSNGRWSLTNATLFFTLPGASPTLVAGEYFLDTDPGIGNAIAFPVSPDSTVVSTNVVVDLSNVEPGLHFFNVRMKDSNGRWGSTTSSLFFTLPGADNPTITGGEYFFDTDPGVGNGLAFAISPDSAASANLLVDLSGVDLGPHFFYIRMRDSNGRWGNPTAHFINVLKNNAGIAAFEYAIDTDPGPGNGARVTITPTPDVETFFTIPLDTVAEGPHTLYLRAQTDAGTWGHTEIIPFGVCNLLPPVPALTELGTKSVLLQWPPAVDATHYRLDVSTDNFQTFLPGYQDKIVSDTTELVASLLPDAVYQFRIRSEATCLSTDLVGNFTTYEQTLPSDSTALADLFAATNGPAWLSRIQWLDTPVAGWQGVTVDSGRVTALVLPFNNLVGGVPPGITALSALDSLDLRGNELVSFPDVSTMPALGTLELANNRLTFEDLEPNIGISYFAYSPQKAVGSADTIMLVENEPLYFSFTVGGSANEYQWEKDSLDVPGEVTDSISKIASMADNGIWRLKITNPIVPGLELMSQSIWVIVEYEGITGDSLVLVSLYNATNGPAWTNKTNWLTGLVSSWSGVTTGNDKVTSINLPNNNLQGSVPAGITALSMLHTLNLADNRLDRVPDFSPLPSIDTINISGNHLDFADLEFNTDVAGINYHSQRAIGVAGTEYVTVGDYYSLSGTVAGTANVYQWLKDNGPVVGDSIYAIPAFAEPDQGVYRCEITSPLVPGLTLRTADKRLIGVTTLSGTLYAAPATVATAGGVQLLRITEGGYDSIPAIPMPVNTNGTFTFNNIVLGDYLLVGLADTLTYERALPTYVPGTAYWEEADTLQIVEGVTGKSIISVYKPDDQLTGEGTLFGIVLEDDGLGGRTKATKRVGGAGVSARRSQGTGRGTEVLEIVGYVFTNEQGEFSIEGLPPGEYVFNVQYPGYPMDTESFLDFVIGTGPLDETVQVEATVVAGAITVKEIIITGLLEKDYAADIYPNPTEGTLVIRFASPDENRTLRVMGTLGKALLSQPAPGIETILNTSTWSPGIYVLSISTQEGVQKIVKVMKR